MAEIMEVMDDIKRGIGDKGFYILIACAGAFGLYNLLKGSNDSAELASTRVVTQVASYPDAVTNANVIIDSIQNSIDYSEGVITDKIDGLDTSIKDYLEENFEATNNYINSGLESQKDLLEKNFDEIKGSITDTQDSIASSNDWLQGVVNKTPAGAISGIGQDMANGTVKESTNKITPKQVGVPLKAEKVEYYTYKTAKGLNTSTSIVDALKATGVNSSMANRKKIAAANGIKNYTGTYSQNVALLSKLKTGKLQKA